MSYTVILQNESGTIISQLKGELTIQKTDGILLKYLDPYGDAIFNYLQMPDLITDLRAIPDQDSLILQVIEMAIQCRNGRLLFGRRRSGW